MPNPLRVLAVALLGVTTLVATARADVLAYYNPQGGVGVSNRVTASLGGSVGMEFTPTADITVSALGLYSFRAQNGTPALPFTGTDYATIFDVSDGSVVAQVKFSSTSKGRQVQGTYDYVIDLKTAVTLEAGETYSIAANYSSGGANDNFIDNGGTGGPGSLTDKSGLLTFGGSYYVQSFTSPNVMPSVSTGTGIRYGAATFLFSAAANDVVTNVDEPTSWALLVGGTGLVALARRQRRLGFAG